MPSAGTLPGSIRGLILDIDGTLLLHDRAIPGAAEMLADCEARGLRYRLATNTTRRSRAATAGVLRDAGLDVAAEAVLQPAVLARRMIVDSGRRRAGLLVPEEARADLQGVEPDERSPDWVVVADIGPGFDYARMNAALGWLRGGARLLALHKNPCWHASAELGWVLDAGAYVAALEYASGREATVVGKPSPAFFELALADLGLPAREVLVVGDDVAADARGGAAAGCRTALVRTGSFRGTEAELLGFAPDLVLASVADLLA
jgi:HAD superfamily hydrolase (TIGR01458 family)